MYNNIFNHININTLSILRMFILVYAFSIIAIKITALLAKRRKQTVKSAKDTIIAETKMQRKPNLDLPAINFSVIIILCLCAVVFFLVQNGYYNHLCRYDVNDVIQYWNILFCFILSIVFIFSDINSLFNIKFMSLIISSKWFNAFEIIILTLYIPITISLIIVCQ